MGLLPSAPHVELRVPGAIFAGKPTAVRVDLRCDDELAIDGVTLEARGLQGWVIGAGKSQVTHRVTYPRYRTRLADRGRLPVGVTTYQTELTLPPDTAISHATGAAYARFELEIHVDIPWWPDARPRYVLEVRRPYLGELVRRPYAARSTDQPGRPRIEVSLASNRVIAGEVLVGSCALFHVDDRKPREIELALVPDLILRGRGRPRQRAGAPLRMAVALPAGSGGEAVPWRMQIPHAITPTFGCATHDLRWFLVAKTGSFFGPTVEVVVPLEIADRSAAASTPALALAPRLADQRIAQAFAAFAGRAGWTALDDADPLARDEHPTIVRHVGEQTLVLGYAYRTEGAAVVARVLHRSLGLGLAVAPGSALRHAFFHDIEVSGDPADDPGALASKAARAWDRAHHVAARSATQTRPFLRAVVPALIATGERGVARLARWTDDAIVFEHATVDPTPTVLEALAAELAHVGAAIAEAATAIAPPPGVVTDLYAWHRVAGALDGELAPGELAIDGTLERVHASIELAWPGDDDPRDADGEPIPRAIRVHVGDPEHASEQARAYAFAVATPALVPASLALPEGVAAQLATWPLEIASLEVADGVASAELAIGEDRRADADAALALARRLRAVVGLLEPAVAPYR